MRRLLTLLVFSVSSISIPQAPTRVTVAQLAQFLASRRASKQSDRAIAERLEQVQLTEQLTARALERIESQRTPGPETIEQLRLLAASSIFSAPPLTELPDRAAPDDGEQRRMMDAVIGYVNTALERLPDFFAVRTTDTFDNRPSDSASRHEAPKSNLRLVRETRREITYRNGKEIVDSAANGNGSGVAEDFTTRGEFGPVLKTVLADSFRGKVAWHRWQASEAGALVAVFGYSVPRQESHYVVDFCCYRKSTDDPASYPFKSRAAYHGELYIDPATGAVDRITLEADLTEDDPVMVSAIAVQYGLVNIGDKNYVCPVRGVSVLKVHNLKMEETEKIGPERLINEVRFTGYHKFASTMTIVPNG